MEEVAEFPGVGVREGVEHEALAFSNQGVELHDSVSVFFLVSETDEMWALRRLRA